MLNTRHKKFILSAGVLILAILIGSAVYFGQLWFKYQRAVFETYANQVCTALDKYSTEHNGTYPERLRKLIPNYISEQNIEYLYTIDGLAETEYAYEPNSNGTNYSMYTRHPGYNGAQKGTVNLRGFCRLANSGLPLW